MALHSCKKCGRRVQNFDKGKDCKCDCCGSITYPVPQQYLLNDACLTFKDKESEQLLIEELVKPSPEFDQYLFDHRDEILSQKHEEFQAKMNHGKAILQEQSRQVKCTYCGSTNVRKIGYVSRGISTYLWGLASKKIAKQWHCNNCGSDF